MRLRITRTWQVDTPPARLEAGNIYDVASSLAMYLLALGHVEVLREGRQPHSVVRFASTAAAVVIPFPHHGRRLQTYTLALAGLALGLTAFLRR